MAVPPFSQLLVYELPKPLRKLSPYPCKDQEHENDENQTALHHRRAEQFRDDFVGKHQRKKCERHPDEHPGEPFENSPTDGNFGLRSRKFAAAATGADFGAAWIGVQARTELPVEASPAGVAEERVSWVDSSAVVATHHGRCLMSGS